MSEFTHDELCLMSDALLHYHDDRRKVALKRDRREPGFYRASNFDEVLREIVRVRAKVHEEQRRLRDRSAGRADA